MIRKLFVLFFLLISFAGFSQQEPPSKKFKKRSIASDSFRSRVKALADSIQKNRAVFDSMRLLEEKVQPDAAPIVQPEAGKEKKEGGSCLLLAAGVAVLAAFFFLFRRKRK